MPHGKHASPRINFHVTEAFRDRVKAFAQRTGQTVTAVIEKALDEYLDRNDKPDSDEEEK